jgi:hypothetical protein
MRKLAILALALVMVLSVSTYATDLLRPTGYEAITIDTTAGGKFFTVAKYYNTTTQRVVSDYAIVVLETAQIRFTVDGTAPTALVGTPMEISQAWALESFDELKNFRAFRTGDTSGSLKVIFYKRYTQ